MPFTLSDGRPQINSPEDENHDRESIEAFSRLVQAGRRGNVQAAKAEIKQLRSCGWSVCSIAVPKGAGR